MPSFSVFRGGESIFNGVLYTVIDASVAANPRWSTFRSARTFWTGVYSTLRTLIWLEWYFMTPTIPSYVVSPTLYIYGPLGAYLDITVPFRLKKGGEEGHFHSRNGHKAEQFLYLPNRPQNLCRNGGERGTVAACSGWGLWARPVGQNTVGQNRLSHASYGRSLYKSTFPPPFSTFPFSLPSTQNTQHNDNYP